VLTVCQSQAAIAKKLLSKYPQMFVPACTKNGQFERRQCHKGDNAQEYCWCVDPASGLSTVSNFKATKCPDVKPAEKKLESPTKKNE
jgi:hypothetical protein